MFNRVDMTILLLLSFLRKTPVFISEKKNFAVFIRSAYTSRRALGLFSSVFTEQS